MKLEQQVCSLELSKKLKELSCKQESYFWWTELPIIDGNEETIGKEWAISTTTRAFTSFFSAFTVAELGEMLPWGYTSGKFIPEEGGFMVKNELSGPPFNRTADTEADARAAMMCYLLENKLIPVAA